MEDQAELFKTEEVPKDVKGLERLATYAGDIKMRVTSLEQLIYQLKGELINIERHRLPDLMHELGLKKFESSNGIAIKIKDTVTGNLPGDPEKRDIALNWLEDNGAGELIKTTIEAKFGRGSLQQVRETEKLLEDAGIEYSAKEGIHNMTFLAFIRERLRKGEDVPFDMLGVYAFLSAEIKLPAEEDHEAK